MALPSTPAQPLPSNASISIRDYIYFLPHPLPNGTPVPYTIGLPDTNPLNHPPQPFEPTSTLVLTSPAKTFIDIRILKPVLAGEDPLPNDGGHPERLEWAFSGKSRSHVIPDPYTVATGGSYPTQGTRIWAGPVTRASWTHWLDSKHAVGTPEAQIPKDEGIMFTLSATQTLEHGSGPNAHTGEMHSYEELWTDLPILPTYPSTSKISIVLRLDVPAHNIRGVVIRLGQFCQGILMKGEYVTIERWEFDEKKEEVVGGKQVSGRGEWKRRARIGDAFLPCAMTFKPENMKVGGLVKYFDYEWAVDEVVEWRDG